MWGFPKIATFFPLLYLVYTISSKVIMAKKKNYLSNAELRDEILKCITDGFDKAVANGFDVTLPYWYEGSSESEADEEECTTIPIGCVFDSENPELQEKYELAIKNGYVPERSYWIRRVREYDKDQVNELVRRGEITPEEARILDIQMRKPVVSDKLAKMFQLIVENIARSFYWSDPEDGNDCKANAVLDLCSNFWKYEPIDLNGRNNSAFAFCSQIAYFGIAGAHRILHPKKYNGTISISCLDENGKPFDLYNL